MQAFDTPPSVPMSSRSSSPGYQVTFTAEPLAVIFSCFFFQIPRLPRKSFTGR